MWASRWSSRVVLGAVILAVAGAGPAGATPLTPTLIPLPGSTFQGADGNQADASPNRDWASVRVVHVEDMNDDDSAFVRGSKENRPFEWELGKETSGVTPASVNIRDAWGTIEQTGGNTFLQLAFSRQTSTGTAFLGFELNQDKRLWNNGKARIPCRRDGDVQIAYEPSGSTVEVQLRRWDTGTTDAGSGCARTGEFVDVTNPAANRHAQAAINAMEIDNELPGFYAGTIPAERFGETSLNLAELVEQAFGDECLAFRSVWMHSRSSPNAETSNMQDYVAPHRLDVRTCSASGTKFFDLDADGVRDRGEPGIPRFVIWADYDNDGVRDPIEPFGISDRGGQYVVHDIQPPGGTYMLREQLLPRRPGVPPPGSDAWNCSFPNRSTTGGTGSAPGGQFGCAWGPIDVGTTPNATGKDFGNWFPGRLTVKKVLAPANDPGRFDLLVDGQVEFSEAGNGGGGTLTLPPGTYNVAERAFGTTDPTAYDSSMVCSDQTRRGTRRPIVSQDVRLKAGQHVTCTFTNARPGAPAIAIQKLAPTSADAGDTLRYRLVVTNPADVAFEGADVVVSDPSCDDDPVLVDQRDASGKDDTEGTLDPGDKWTYQCFRRTSDGGAACRPTTVDNTGTVTVTGTDATASADAETALNCPDQPEPPDPVPPDPPGPVPPDPDEPGPVVPPGPVPPDSGDAARAGAIFSRAVSGCIRSRVPRVNLNGTRIARVRVFINGRLRRGLTVRTLQQRVRPRVTLAPGRYRITARVTFQRGTDSPPVTLAGVVRICGASAPRFTG